MSKLKMLKFEAAALQQNGKELIEALQKLGVTELSKVMSLSNYKLTAYYDGLTGGRVRIIVAEVK